MLAPCVRHVVATDALDRPVRVADGARKNAVETGAPIALGGHGHDANGPRRAVERAGVAPREIALVEAGLVVGVVPASRRNAAACREFDDLIADSAAGAVRALVEMLDVGTAAVRQATWLRSVGARAPRQQNYYSRQSRAFHDRAAQRARVSASTDGKAAA